MNTTRGPRLDDQKRGFTLVELLISLTLMGLVLSAILGPMIFLLKSNMAAGNFTVMSDQSRNGVDQLGMDLRSTVDLASASDSGLSLVVEDPNGIQSAIVYTYDTETGDLSRQVDGGNARSIIDDLTELSFSYYDSNDETTSNLIDIKKVEVTMTLTMSVLDKRQIYDFRSARFVLRNRPAG